jgi:hypothetical protein
VTGTSTSSSADSSATGSPIVSRQARGYQGNSEGNDNLQRRDTSIVTTSSFTTSVVSSATPTPTNIGTIPEVIALGAFSAATKNMAPLKGVLGRIISRMILVALVMAWM